MDEQCTHGYSSDKNALSTFHPDSSNAISRAPCDTGVPARKSVQCGHSGWGWGGVGEGRQADLPGAKGREGIFATGITGQRHWRSHQHSLSYEQLPRRCLRALSGRGLRGYALLGMERRRKLRSGLGLQSCPLPCALPSSSRGSSNSRSFFFLSNLNICQTKKRKLMFLSLFNNRTGNTIASQ